MSNATDPVSGRLRYVAVFVVGIAVGLGVTTLLSGGNAGPSAEDAMGTFLPRSSVERMELIDSKTISAGDMKGAVETRGGRGIVMMEVAIESDAAGQITVEFDHDVLSPRGFNQQNAMAGEIHFTRNEYQLVNSGSNRYQMTFRKRQEINSNMRVQISGGGGEQVIEVGTQPTS